MASTTPDKRTGQEKAGSQEYTNRHFEKIFQEGFSFSGYERDKVYFGGQSGKFADVSAVSGADSISDGRGTIFADFDNDGDTDIFITTIQGAVHLLYRNNIGQDSNWLRVSLVGTKSNRDAVGAIVKVTQGGTAEAKVISAGAGYLSSHDQRMLFGLGKAGAADKVEVRWPSGKVTTVSNVAANQTIKLKEGEDSYKSVQISRFELPDPVVSKEPATLVAKGDVFPRMSLPAPGRQDRKSLASMQKDGQYLLVNFWATWCVPCNKEMPHLQKLSQQYAGKLKVVGISLDVANPESVPGFLKKKGITYPVLMGDEATPLQVFNEENVMIPASFLVGPGGVIKGVWTGGSEATIKDLDEALEKLLAR